MDTQRLKDKILQLAIQGKLVEQDPNDEPASILLEKIKEEKDKLVKEKKIRKPKKLPPIGEDEKPFEIPESWEWVRLGDVALINMGQSPKGQTVNDREGMEFHQGKVCFGDRYINKSDKYTSAPKKIAQKGDILVSVRAPVGDVNITDREICIGRGLCAISSLGNMMSEYYFYLISALKKHLIDKATGTTFLAITASDIKEMLVPLPPLAEQRRIVEKVDQLFAIIDELDSNKEDLLKAIKLTRNQVLQKAIQGKLVEQDPEDEPANVLLEKIKKEKDRLVKEKKIRKPRKLAPITEDEKPFKIPESWEWVRLADITHPLILNDGDWIVSKNMDDKGSVKLLQLGSIGYGKYIKKGFKYITEETFNKLNCKEIKKGDILINRLLKDNMCVCEMPPIQGKTITTVDTCFIKPNHHVYNSRYLLYLFLSEYFQDQVFKKASGTTRQRISKGNLTAIAFPLPPLAEQKRIVEKVDKIMSICDKLEEQIDGENK